MFYLDADPDARLRLKGFSATSKAGKSTIRIELETADPYELGYALERLATVEKGQKAKPKPAAKPEPVKRLALPAPRLALPEPGDER